MLKKSYFNKGLFLSMIKRYWPLWFIYFFTLIIMLPVNTIGILDSEYSFTVDVINNAWNGGACISFIMAICSMACVFGFLYSPRQSGLIASLPINRTSVFTSSFAAAFSAVTVSNILVFLISIIVELKIGRFEIAYLLKWLAIMTLMNITFFGFAAFCATLTSNIVVLPLVYIVLSFTAYVVDSLARALISQIIFGVAADETFLIYLSPFIALLSNGPQVYYAYDMGYEHPIVIMGEKLWLMLSLYSFSGLLFTVAALFIFRVHKMETTTDVIAINILKPVFKYCMTFGCSLVLTTWMYSLFFGNSYTSKGLVTLILLSVIGAVIGYFASLMMIHKKITVFKEKKLGLYISCVIIVLSLIICKADLFKVEAKIPDLNNIQEVSISVYGENRSTLKEKDNIQKVLDLHKEILDNKDTYANEDINSSATEIYILYTLENGNQIKRIYDLADDESGYLPEPLIDEVENILNLKEANIDRSSYDFSLNDVKIMDAYINYYSEESCQYEDLYLTDEEFKDLYENAMMQDIQDGTLGQVWIKPDGDIYNSMYALDICCTVNMNTDDGEVITKFLYISLSKDSANTLQWILDNTNITPVHLKEYDEAYYG